jgi:hypothetical protein
MSGLRHEVGDWVAPFEVAAQVHVFAVDALSNAEGVGGWLSPDAVCRSASIQAGDRLATKAEAVSRPMCRACLVWLARHLTCHVIYAPPGESHIVEPEAVGIADLAAHGWAPS